MFTVFCLHFSAIEEYEKQIKLLQHELALGYVELKAALKADGIPESESEQILNSTMDLDAEEMEISRQIEIAHARPI